MNTNQDLVGRAGWDILIFKLVYHKQIPVSFEALLDHIARNIKSAPVKKQESMNRCLCEIGIRYPSYTERCIQIGEQLGHLDNKPVSKGCTSSYAPEWIAAGVKKRTN